MNGSESRKMDDPAPPPQDPTAEPLPRPSRTRKRSVPRLLAYFALVILSLCAAGAAGGYWALRQWADRPFGPAESHRITIERGTSTREIGRALYHQGLINHDWPFLAWVRLKGHADRLQAGEYRVATPITPAELVRCLGHGSFERTLTIPEGWTSRQVAARLLAEGWIADERQWLDLVADPGPLTGEIELLIGEKAPARGLEGYLFPDTYRLEEGTSPQGILRRMSEEFSRQWQRAEPGNRDERSQRLSDAQVVTLGSMVQREARGPDEMPMIASVYLNRLTRRMRLQCCATVHYALGEVWDRPLRYADLKIESAYNTYVHDGLPPGPIANPGRAAIEAVLRPADTDHLFYVYSGDGAHTFTRTFRQHQKAVREARRRNPEVFVAQQDDD